MTEVEFGKLVMAIKTYYQKDKDKLFPNKESVELWYRELCDLDYLVAETAIRKHVATSVFPPTIAEIREAAVDVMQGGAAEDWSSGWEKVQKLIRAKGSYATQKDMEEALDEISLKAVRALGWQKICGVEGDPNPDADRANFRMIYGTIAQRKRAAAQLPESVRNLIENTSRKLVEKTEVRSDNGC